MINIERHTIQLGTGDVDISILTSPNGNPVLAFSEMSVSPTPSNSIFMGFTDEQSIDDFISVLRAVKKKYYAKPELSHTQQFRIYSEET